MGERDELSDWAPAPNIAGDPEVYELENEALARDGRLDAVLHELAPWTGSTIVDAFMAHHTDASLSYHFAVHEWRP